MRSWMCLILRRLRVHTGFRRKALIAYFSTPVVHLSPEAAARRNHGGAFATLFCPACGTPFPASYLTEFQRIEAITPTMS